MTGEFLTDGFLFEFVCELIASFQNYQRFICCGDLQNMFKGLWYCSDPLKLCFLSSVKFKTDDGEKNEKGFFLCVFFV